MTNLGKNDSVTESVVDACTEENTSALSDKLVVFDHCQIRRIFHKDAWYFSILDVIRVLTGSTNPRRYWPELKTQLTQNEGFAQLLGKIEQLKLESSDGKKTGHTRFRPKVSI